MQMRAGGLSGHTYVANLLTAQNFLPHTQSIGETGEVGIIGLIVFAVFEHDQIAITTAIAGKHHYGISHGANRFAHRYGEIDADMVPTVTK